MTHFRHPVQSGTSQDSGVQDVHRNIPRSTPSYNEECAHVITIEWVYKIAMKFTKGRIVVMLVTKTIGVPLQLTNLCGNLFETLAWVKYATGYTRKATESRRIFPLSSLMSNLRNTRQRVIQLTNTLRIFFVCRCQMGGLVVDPHDPAPNYVWEMLYADTGELFLHFDVRTRAKYLP